MFRFMLRNFMCSFTLHPPQALKPFSRANFLQAGNCRSIFQTQKTPEDLSDVNNTLTNNGNAETDSEYIVPYRIEYEFSTNQNVLIEALRKHFRLTDSDVKSVLSDEIVNRAYKQRSLLRCIEMMSLEGVTKKSFINNPWIITLEKTRLDKKLAMIRSMAIRDINHFVPFLRLTAPRLHKLVSLLNRETNIVPHKNRVYYISEKLQMDPSVVSKYLVNRLFVLEMPFHMLAQNLQNMVDYNVSSINILRDLWAFRYTPKSVKIRLERAKNANKDKIMPWMVRCPEPILQRSLKLSLDELAVLGDKSTVAEYVAERLQFDVEEAQAIMARHPQVLRVRVTKIKEVLDYLLYEAGFNRYEIAQVPRILCHSLKTTKQRLDELKTYGCRPSSLVIVCRSKREYEKFVQYWLSMHRSSDSRESEARNREEENSKTK